MSGIVLFFGLLINCVLVKDLPVTRDYIKDDKGKIVRQKAKVAIDEDPEDSGNFAEEILPEGYELVKGVGQSLVVKTKLLFKSTWGALTSGDMMLYYVLYGQFVNSMLAAKAGTIIYLWTTKWIVKTEEDKVLDSDMTGAESWDRYLEFSLLNFIAASLLIPLFGYLSDKVDLGFQLILTFGLRGVACLAMFVLDSPEGNIVLFTFVMITINSSLQGTVVNSLWAKRLPGDVRGVMQGGKTVVSNLGHLSFVLLSLASAHYFEDVQRSVVFCAIMDGSMCFATIIAFVTANFDHDLYSGSNAREKGKDCDKKV